MGGHKRPVAKRLGRGGGAEVKVNHGRARKAQGVAGGGGAATSHFQVVSGRHAAYIFAASPATSPVSAAICPASLSFCAAIAR